MLPPSFLDDKENIIPDIITCNPKQETIPKQLTEFKFIKEITHATINYGFDCFFAAFVALSGKSMVIYSSNLCLYQFILGPDTNEKVVDNAHTSQILCVRYYVEKNKEKEYILTSSTNTCIKVWLMKDWSMIVNIDRSNEYMTSIYSALILFDNKEDYDYHKKYIVGSTAYEYSDVIRVWNFKGEYQFSIGEIQMVYFMDVLYQDELDNKKYLVVATTKKLISYDFDLKKIYHTYNRTSYSPITDHYDFTIQYYKGNYVIFASEKNGYISMFDFHTAKCLKNFTIKYSGFDEIDGILIWDEKYMITCHYKKYSLNVYDIDTTYYVKELYTYGHSQPISCKKLYYPNFGPVIIAHYSNNFTTGSLCIFG